MTWLEIVDSAVKIGLGAAIGGFFTYLLNRQAQRHEIRKEIRLENRQTLIEASARFESIHANVVALSQEIVRELHSYLAKSKVFMSKSKSKKKRLGSRIPKPPDFAQKNFDVTKKLLLELYSLQGVLMLHGYTKMSAVIYEYTANVSAISPIHQEDESQEYIPEPENMKKFYDLRIRFYKAAQEYLAKQVEE